MNDNTNLTHCLLCENLKAENKKLKAALEITLGYYADMPEDEEDEKFIEECRELLK